MKKLAGSILIVILLIQTIHAQNRTFNLNEESVGGLKSQAIDGNVPTPAFENASRARQLFINPVIQHPPSIQLNDTILLDLFENKQYKAAIDKIERDVNNTEILRGHIVGHEFGSFIISTFKGKSFMTIEVPMNNELYLSKYDPPTNRYFLLQIDKSKQKILPGAPPMIPPTRHPINKDTTLIMDPRMQDLPPSEKDSKINPSPRADPSMKIDEYTQDTITVMVVYTPAAAAWSLAYETHINNTIATFMINSQAVLDNSHTFCSLLLVHSAQVEYTELDDFQDLNNLTFMEDGILDTVHILRDTHGADLVVMLGEINFVGGLAWILDTPEGLPHVGFSINRVQQASWNPVVIHEIGHNLGCSHHKLQNEFAGPGLYSYSAGWRWANEFRDVFCTVMTYAEGHYFADGTSAYQLPSFSNPDVLFQGMPTGHPTEADNARTIRQSKAVVASYRTNHTQPPCSLPFAAGPISGFSSMCQGDAPLFYSTNAVLYADAYSWRYSGSGVIISPGNYTDISIHFEDNATSGVLTVRGINDCGEGIAASLPLEVLPKPITPTISLTPRGLISDALTGNQWYDSNGSIPGAIDREFTPSASGNYFVVVLSNGCTSNASNLVSYIPTNIPQVPSVKTFSIYPNPATQELTIERKGPAHRTDFDILNARGQIVLSGTLIDRTILQIATLPPGLYLVRLKSEETGEWLKFLKN